MKDRKISLVDFIFFEEGGLGYWKWLPICKSEALRFTDGFAAFHVYADPNYSETFTFLPDIQNISTGNHWIRALRVDVLFMVDPALEEAIMAKEPPEELITRIASSYRHLEDALRDICRNDLGQWWLEHPIHDPEETDRDLLGGMHVIDNTGSSQQFPTGSAIRLKSQIPDEKLLITKEKWKTIEELIAQNYRTDVGLVCLANAEFLCHYQNYRLAIIEAVIALERAIFKYIGPYIPPKKRELLKERLSKNSVCDAAKELLPITIDKLGISNDTIYDCLEAINKRNLIVHKTCFRLQPSQVEQYIRAITTVVRKLIPHKFCSKEDDIKLPFA